MEDRVIMLSRTSTVATLQLQTGSNDILLCDLCVRVRTFLIKSKIYQSLSIAFQFVLFFFLTLVLVACSSGGDGASTENPSILNIKSLAFFESGGRDGHGGLIEIQTAPITGSGLFELSTEQDIASMEIVFASTNDTDNKTYIITTASYFSNETYKWNVEPEIPANPFVIKIKALGVDNKEYLYTSKEYVPKTFSARLTSDQPMLTPGMQYFELAIDNYGADREFDIAITNNYSYEAVLDGSSTRVAVPSNGKMIIPFRLTIPEHISTGFMRFTVDVSVSDSTSVLTVSSYLLSLLLYRQVFRSM